MTSRPKPSAEARAIALVTLPKLVTLHAQCPIWITASQFMTAGDLKTLANGVVSLTAPARGRRKR